MAMQPMTLFLCPTPGQEGYVGSTVLFTNKRYGVTWPVPTPFLLCVNEQLWFELLVVLLPSSRFFVGVWYV